MSRFLPFISLLLAFFTLMDRAVLNDFSKSLEACELDALVRCLRAEVMTQSEHREVIFEVFKPMSGLTFDRSTDRYLSA